MIRLIVANSPVGAPDDDLKPLIRAEVQRQIASNRGGDVALSFQVSPDPRDDWWVFQLGGSFLEAPDAADRVTNRVMQAMQARNLI